MGPPLLPFVLAIGITGHRSAALTEAALPALERRVHDVLATIARNASAIATREADYFAPGPPSFRLVSPLADGADQLAAGSALALGFELQAVLPFERGHSRAELADEAARLRFDALAEAATCLLELPGDAEHAAEAYAMVGRATVAHCDLLVALWDGLPARGPGGTAEVIELAVERGTPVVHVPTDPAAEVTIRWSAFDPAVITRFGDPTPSRPFDEAQVERLLSALLTPPPDAAERRFFGQFQRERRRRLQPRIEYPLLLALAGISPVRRKDWESDHYSAESRIGWARYRDVCATMNVCVPIGVLERFYDWSDGLAGHFGQSYRSGHVFNFLLGALAVLLALAALLLPEGKLLLVVAELVVIGAIFANTRIGIRQEWHRRWLDYRQLAERLRPMRSLKLTGLAAPDHPGTAAFPVSRRWIDWFAAAAWRASGCPSGRIDAADVTVLARIVAEHEVGPQIAYHQASAFQVDKLDRRLAIIGSGLFAATLLSCVLLLASLWLDPHQVERNIAWFAIAGAGLPAIGTAILGIRLHSDLGARAVRSEASARTLARIADELASDPGRLPRVADLAEQAARVMLVDLDEWRLINQQHDLALA